MRAQLESKPEPIKPSVTRRRKPLVDFKHWIRREERLERKANRKLIARMSLYYSIRFKNLWKTPEYRAKIDASWTPERRLQASITTSAIVKLRWATPGYRENMSEFMCSKWNEPDSIFRSPEYIQSHSDGIRAYDVATGGERHRKGHETRKRKYGPSGMKNPEEFSKEGIRSTNKKV